MNFDAVKTVFFEQMCDHRPAGIGYQTLTLRSFTQPVAELHLAIEFLNFVRADNAREMFAMPDAGGDPVPRGELFERGADEGDGVVRGKSGVNPREPLAQVRAVLIDQRENLGGMAFFQ